MASLAVISLIFRPTYVGPEAFHKAMVKSKQSIAASTMQVIQRRPVGKGAWKLTIIELLESERCDLQKLKRLRNKFQQDNEALGLLIELYEEKSERLISLNELLHYKESTNGTAGDG